MKQLRIFCSLLFLCFLTTGIWGVEIVLERGVEHYALAVAEFDTDIDAGEEIREVIIDNFSAYPHFNVTSTNLEEVSSPLYRETRIRPNYDDWEEVDAQFVIFGRVEERNERLHAEFGIFDIRARGIILNREMSTPAGNQRGLAHRISSDIFYNLTGAQASFSSRIAYISDASGETEIHVMDWDGHNDRRITRQNSLLVAPEWAIDNSFLYFTSYRYVNPDLFRLDMQSGEIKVISDSPLQNLGATYSNVRNRIVVALGKEGNPELYSMDPNGNDVRRLTTTTRAIESDPCWSPCGDYLVFTSDRAGPLRAYVMDYETEDTRRLTRENVMQSEPVWSVRDEIALTTRVGPYFQIATVNANGTDFEVITEGQFDSYQPSWSPCGEFIYFISNEENNWRVYRMNSDGSNRTMLTDYEGLNKNPAPSDFYY